MEKLEFAVNILPYIVAAASAVAAITPTEADNRAIAWLRRIANVLAINVHHAAPGDPDRAHIDAAAAAQRHKGHRQKARTRGGRHRG